MSGPEHGFPMSFCPIHHPERGGRPVADVSSDGAPADGLKVRFKTRATAEIAGLTIVKAELAPGETSTHREAGEARVLRQLLAINAGMFVLELGIGIAAQSTGVIADSVDMFADAAVYGLSLYGVGRSVTHQHRAARLSGGLQLLLAAGVLAEVVRRGVVGSQPVAPVMMAISTNDVLANLGVIVAGVLVMLTGSAVPDLVVGTAIGLLVLSGAVRILRITPR